MRHGFLRGALAATLLFFMSIASAMATEEPGFRLIEKSGEFDLRQYAPMIVADTDQSRKKTEKPGHVPGLTNDWRARHDSNVRPLPSEGSTLSS